MPNQTVPRTALLALVLAAAAVAPAGALDVDSSAEPAVWANQEWVQFDGLPAGKPGTDLSGMGITTFGGSAALGIPYDDAVGKMAGSVRYYERQVEGPDETFALVHHLLPPSPSAHDGYGVAVDFGAGGLLVGAHLAESEKPGAAYLYPWLPNGLSDKPVELVPTDGAKDLGFGCAVALDDDNGPYEMLSEVVAVVAAPALSPKDTGAAYVFRGQDDGTWKQEAKLVPADGRTGTLFAYAVAVYNDVIAVSAIDDGAGAVYVYRNGPDGWKQEAKLTSDAGPADSMFGRDVELYDEQLLVGSALDHQYGFHERLGTPSTHGAAFLFKNDGTWKQTFRFYPEQPVADESFGAHVALDHGVVAVSAPGRATPGAYYLFLAGQGDTPFYQKARLVPTLGCEGYHVGDIDMNAGYRLMGSIDSHQAGEWESWGFDFASTQLAKPGGMPGRAVQFCGDDGNCAARSVPCAVPSCPPVSPLSSYNPCLSVGICPAEDRRCDLGCTDVVTLEQTDVNGDGCADSCEVLVPIEELLGRYKCTPEPEECAGFSEVFQEDGMVIRSIEPCPARVECFTAFGSGEVYECGESALCDGFATPDPAYPWPMYETPPVMPTLHPDLYIYDEGLKPVPPVPTGAPVPMHQDWFGQDPRGGGIAVYSDPVPVYEFPTWSGDMSWDLCGGSIQVGCVEAIGVPIPMEWERSILWEEFDDGTSWPSAAEPAPVPWNATLYESDTIVWSPPEWSSEYAVPDWEMEPTGSCLAPMEVDDLQFFDQPIEIGMPTQIMVEIPPNESVPFEVQAPDGPSVTVTYEAGDVTAVIEAEAVVATDPDLLPEPAPPLADAIQYLQVEPYEAQQEDPWLEEFPDDREPADASDPATPDPSAPELVRLEFPYTDLQVSDGGLKEAQLTIHYWTGDEWVDLLHDVPASGIVEGATTDADLQVFGGQLDTDRNVVWVEVSHTSTYALGPRQAALPSALAGESGGGMSSGMQVLVWATLGMVGGAAVLMGTAVLLLRRK